MSTKEVYVVNYTAERNQFRFCSRWSSRNIRTGTSRILIINVLMRTKCISTWTLIISCFRDSYRKGVMRKYNFDNRYSIRLIFWTVDWRKGEFGTKKTVPIRGIAFSMATMETTNLLLCTIKVAWPGTGELGKKPKRFSLFQVLNVRTISGETFFWSTTDISNIFAEFIVSFNSCCFYQANTFGISLVTTQVSQLKSLCF